MNSFSSTRIFGFTHTLLQSTSTTTRSLLQAFLPIGSQIQCRTKTRLARATKHNKSGTMGRRLGLKVSHLQNVEPNRILVRQRGTKWHPGIDVNLGRDHTLHASTAGVVHVCKFHDPYRRGHSRVRKFMNILPEGEVLPDKILMQRCFLEERVLHARWRKAKLKSKGGPCPIDKFMVPKEKLVEYIVRQAQIKELSMKGVRHRQDVNLETTRGSLLMR